jgi:hypothetical protein
MATLRKVPVVGLAYPIVLKDGSKLTTIAEATAYMLALPCDGKALSNSWQSAAKLIMDGADAEAIHNTNRVCIAAGRKAGRERQK